MSDVFSLFAPVDGVVVPLEAVPDPVFAQRLGGDGIAIEPLGNTIVAPCDAHVRHVHRARHALTLEAHGLELLIHVGLDTVHLAGEGFTVHVQAGDAVRAGAPLISFDPDVVGRRARSLVTPLLVTDVDGVTLTVAGQGTVRAGQDVVLRVSRAAVSGRTADVAVSAIASRATDTGGAGSGPLRRRVLRITAETGIHARPAATLAAAARRFGAAAQLAKDGRVANVRSVVSLLALEALRGDAVTLTVQGADADAALAALLDGLVPELAEEIAADGTAAASAAPRAAFTGVTAGASAPVAAVSGGTRAASTAADAVSEAATHEPFTRGALRGVTASPGFAVGEVVVLRHDDRVPDRPASTPAEERRELDAAIAAAHVQLEALRARLAADGHEAQATIFGAHQELLEDPDVLDAAAAAIADGRSAPRAWRDAYAVQADRLDGLRNPLLAARATDLRDVGRRVLGLLTGHAGEATDLPPAAIVLADDLSPSDTVSLDRSRVRGFATTTGSATSHVAILARGLGLPAIAGIDLRALAIPAGTPVLLDADEGVLHVGATPAETAAFDARRAESQTRRRAAEAAAHAPAVTRDGHRVEVAANIGDVRDAVRVVQAGGEGVGLLRSEFVFLDRRTAPDEDTQTALYAEAARALGPERRLVIRTLDVGGDKPLPYLPVPHEDNPFLGERGVRLTLAQPALFRTQLRAILRASVHGNVALMFPMIASLEEWRAARAMVEEERLALDVPALPVGIMVETAAAALLAEHFAREADFLSIGTNDLTQYTLAMDRTHPRLAARVDTLHPAMLQLIGRTVAGAHAHGRWVGVCGALAADATAIPVLLGLGVDELSVDVPLLPLVKMTVREWSIAACRAVAEAALAAGTGEEVRAIVARHRTPVSAGAA